MVAWPRPVYVPIWGSLYPAMFLLWLFCLRLPHAMPRGTHLTYFKILSWGKMVKLVCYLGFCFQRTTHGMSKYLSISDVAQGGVIKIQNCWIFKLTKFVYVFHAVLLLVSFGSLRWQCINVWNQKYFDIFQCENSSTLSNTLIY